MAEQPKGRPPAGELDALRSGLRSQHALIRAATEATIKAALVEKTWPKVAERLHVNPRSFERLRADHPEIVIWWNEIHR